MNSIYISLLFISFLLSACVMPVKQSREYKLIVGKKVYRCSVGRSGIQSAESKKEGDGITPADNYPIREMYYRPDRLDRKQIITGLHVIALNQNDGWCDDPKCKEYNKIDNKY